MTRNLYRLWLILLMISGAIALWFSGIAAGGIWQFFCLNAQTSVKILNWQVCELTSSRFALEADYQFELNGVTYDGKTIFENPQFLNRFAAENYMRINGSQSWKTWYWTSHPTYNSLEKEFPRKQCLHALLTLGVFVYFLFARRMILRDRIVNASFE
jgi:hypothetical protein